MNDVLYHSAILPTEVVGFEPTVPITRHGILAGFCNKPLCHTSNVVLKQPIRVLCCPKATIGIVRFELTTSALSAQHSTTELYSINELLSLPFTFPQFASTREVAGAIPTFHPTHPRKYWSVSHIGQQPNGNWWT